MDPNVTRDQADAALTARRVARQELAALVRAGQRTQSEPLPALEDEEASSRRLEELEAALREAQETVSTGEQQLAAIAAIRESRQHRRRQARPVSGDGGGTGTPSSDGHRHADDGASANPPTVESHEAPMTAEAPEVDAAQEGSQAGPSEAPVHPSIDEHLTLAFQESHAERERALQRAAALERAANLERRLLASAAAYERAAATHRRRLGLPEGAPAPRLPETVLIPHATSSAFLEERGHAYAPAVVAAEAAVLRAQRASQASDPVASARPLQRPPNPPLASRPPPLVSISPSPPTPSTDRIPTAAPDPEARPTASPTGEVQHRRRQHQALQRALFQAAAQRRRESAGGHVPPAPLARAGPGSSEPRPLPPAPVAVPANRPRVGTQHAAAPGGPLPTAHALHGMPRPRRPVLPASAAEMMEVTARWRVRLDEDELQEAIGDDAECIICLSELEPNEPLVRLPCSEARAHVFHEECLGRWLLTSAACPTCRRGVRPMLKKDKRR